VSKGGGVWEMVKVYGSIRRKAASYRTRGGRGGESGEKTLLRIERVRRKTNGV